MEIKHSDLWRTSDRELAQELIAMGHEMVGQSMEGLTPYYEFDFSDGLADGIIVSKVTLIDDSDEFTTSDISLVAYLKFRGVHARRSEWEERSMVWVFEDSDEIVSVVAEFYGCPNDIDIRAYNEQVAAVRGQALSERDARRHGARS